MGEIINAIYQNIEVIHVVLFVLGIICFVVELFEPGLGIFAIAGTVMMVIDILVLAENIPQGLLLFGGVLLIVAVFIVVIVVLASKGILPGNLILKANTSNNEGYTAAPKLQIEVGDIGVAQTDLRPSGKAVFGDTVADVVSDGKFINEGGAVKIIQVNGNRIVVKTNEK